MKSINFLKRYQNLLSQFLRCGLILGVITMQSCIDDPNLGNAKTAISIQFDKGPYANQTLEFVTNNSSDELQFHVGKNTTRVFCQPLKSVDERGMNNSSSINFAWQGANVSGNFTASNFATPSSAFAGDIELNYSDGEFLSASIPKGVLLTISSYLEVGELVSGSTSFSTDLSYEKGGNSNVVTTNCELTFKIIRGVDQ